MIAYKAIRKSKSAFEYKVGNIYRVDGNFENCLNDIPKEFKFFLNIETALKYCPFNLTEFNECLEIKNYEQYIKNEFQLIQIDLKGENILKDEIKYTCYSNVFEVTKIYTREEICNILNFIEIFDDNGNLIYYKNDKRQLSFLFKNNKCVYNSYLSFKNNDLLESFREYDNEKGTVKTTMYKNNKIEGQTVSSLSDNVKYTLNIISADLFEMLDKNV